MKIWVLSTCVPGENEPCMPQVFLSEVEAESAFTNTMKDEWRSFEDWADDGMPMEWPDDARKAQDIMAKASPSWGRWEITTHHIDDQPKPRESTWTCELADEIEQSTGLIKILPGQGTKEKPRRKWRGVQLGIKKTADVVAALRRVSRPTFIPENDHGVKPGYYTQPDIVRLLRKHHTNPSAVQFIADMME